MNLKIDFKNLLKPQKSFKKDDRIINPNFYWQIVVYVTLALLFISFGFGFYLFTSIGEEPERVETNLEKQAGKVKKDRILRALEYWRTREKISQSIIYIDPSIPDPSVGPVTINQVAPPPVSIVPTGSN